jgi:hypothetical protein
MPEQLLSKEGELVPIDAGANTGLDELFTEMSQLIPMAVMGTQLHNVRDVEMVANPGAAHGRAASGAPVSANVRRAW